MNLNTIVQTAVDATITGAGWLTGSASLIVLATITITGAVLVSIIGALTTATATKIINSCTNDEPVKIADKSMNTAKLVISTAFEQFNTARPLVFSSGRLVGEQSAEAAIEVAKMPVRAAQYLIP